jgi:hypothetical protein
MVYPESHVEHVAVASVAQAVLTAPDPFSQVQTFSTQASACKLNPDSQVEHLASPLTGQSVPVDPVPEAHEQTFSTQSSPTKL